MKYLFLGDTHNDLDFAESAAKLAREQCAEIIQLGDWGFIWPRSTQLQALSDMLVGLGVRMRFVDGNHDEHPILRSSRSRPSRRAIKIAEGVIYQPRGSIHEDSDGTRFLFLGGAPSIDRAARIPGVSWWPEETITKAEFEYARSARGPFHVIVTHDAPDFPPGFSPKGSPGYQRDQQRSMHYIDELIRHHRPTLHVHGHWHCRYARAHPCGTKVIGLDCNQTDPTYLDDSVQLWSRDTSV